MIEPLLRRYFTEMRKELFFNLGSNVIFKHIIYIRTFTIIETIDTTDENLNLRATFKISLTDTVKLCQFKSLKELLHFL